MAVPSRRALQALVVVLGGVSTATGLATLARGTALIRDPGAVSPDVESEHRFLAAWWTALGPTLWSLVPHIEAERRAVRAIAATTFVGGVARVVAAKQIGRPHGLYQALTAIELLLPPVLVAWQRAVERDAAART